MRELHNFHRRNSCNNRRFGRFCLKRKSPACHSRGLVRLRLARNPTASRRLSTILCHQLKTGGRLGKKRPQKTKAPTAGAFVICMLRLQNSVFWKSKTPAATGKGLIRLRLARNPTASHRLSNNQRHKIRCANLAAGWGTSFSNAGSLPPIP